MLYTHLSLDERQKLDAWKEAGLTQGEMARRLGRSASTIGRELTRNGEPRSNWHDAKKADRFRHERRRDVNQTIHTKLIAGSSLTAYVEEKTRSHWSPEQIAGRLKCEKRKSRNKKGKTVSHERIYVWIYRERKDLIPFLCHSKKRRYRRRNGTKQREMRREEAKKKRIDTRPKDIEKRKELGRWEGDTIVGKEKTQRILTHVERKSRFTCADKIERATAEAINRASVKRLKRFPKRKRQTSTYDNGIEFSAHEKTEQDAQIKIYFAFPYHSWERGTNENTNGLLREFFPKGSPFKDVTQRDLDRAVRFLNTRPRKCLKYLTPEEVFNERCCALN
jgi:IS30 family transposase